MNNTLKKLLRTLLSIGILVGAMWYTLRDVDFAKLTDAMSKANYWWVFAPLPLMIISHYLRGLRWTTLMLPIQAGLSVWNSFSGVMVGYFLNNLVPRSGELVRPYLLSKRERIRFSTAIATIVVERVLDVLSLGLFILGTIYYSQSRLLAALPDVGGKLVNALVVLPAGMIVAITLLLTTNIGEWMLRHTVKRFSEPLYLKLHNYLEAFTNGFSIFKSPGLWWRVVAETVGIWIAYSVPMYLSFIAFGFDTRYGLSFLDANLIFTISTVAYLIAPTPGAFGVYHTLVSQGLTRLFSVPPAEALAFAFVTHGVGYVVQLLLGGGFLLYEQSRGFHLDAVRGSGEEPASAVSS
jgi:glycosyltransferase 2 family protein